VQRAAAAGRWRQPVRTPAAAHRGRQAAAVRRRQAAPMPQAVRTAAADRDRRRAQPAHRDPCPAESAHRAWTVERDPASTTVIARAADSAATPRMQPARPPASAFRRQRVRCATASSQGARATALSPISGATGSRVGTHPGRYGMQDCAWTVERERVSMTAIARADNTAAFRSVRPARPLASAFPRQRGRFVVPSRRAAGAMERRSASLATAFHRRQCATWARAPAGRLGRPAPSMRIAGPSQTIAPVVTATRSP
jgi:hypothetical protein